MAVRLMLCHWHVVVIKFYDKSYEEDHPALLRPLIVYCHYHRHCVVDLAMAARIPRSRPNELFPEPSHIIQTMFSTRNIRILHIKGIRGSVFELPTSVAYVAITFISTKHC